MTATKKYRGFLNIFVPLVLLAASVVFALIVELSGPTPQSLDLAGRIALLECETYNMHDYRRPRNCDDLESRAQWGYRPASDKQTETGAPWAPMASSSLYGAVGGLGVRGADR